MDSNNRIVREAIAEFLDSLYWWANTEDPVHIFDALAYAQLWERETSLYDQDLEAS